VPDHSNAGLLARLTSGFHAAEGLEEASPDHPEQLQPAGHDALVRQQFAAGPGMGRSRPPALLPQAISAHLEVQQRNSNARPISPQLAAARFES
jgi:hypothetical protein